MIRAMKWRDVVQTAAQSLRGNPMRSALTVLGLAIGVGASIAIGSLGTAAVGEVRQEMNRFGVDRIWIAESPGNAVRLSAEDAVAVGGKSDAAPVKYAYAAAACGTKRVSCALTATTGAYRNMERLEIREGRFLMALDDERRLRTAVIEDILEEKLFGSRSALGQRVEIDGTRYTVVGVIRTQTSEYFGTGSDKPRVYVPIGTYQQLTGDESVDEIIVRTQGVSVGKAASRAKEVLAASHASGDRFVVTSMAEQIASAERVVRIVSAVLIVIGIICMLTGGVGVMNVLLTGVRERRREIGVRKALGAKDGEIFAQFVCEAALYGALGAAAGTAAGLILTKIGERVIGIAAPPALWAMACAVGFSLCVGAVCGVYPAMRAAAVSPVTAMRQS